MSNPKYAQLASDIIENVGGKENIATLVHCITRLRFTFVDKTKVNEAALKSLKGVMGVVEQGVQTQLIIGQTVGDVYEEVCSQAGIATQKQLEDGKDEEKKRFSVSAVFDVLSSTFAPIVPAFAGCGIIKGLVTLLSGYGVLDASSGLYTLLQAIGDCAFYFLPFLVAYSAAKKFKTSEIMALSVAGIFMYPTFLNNAGVQISILGVPVTCVKYASQLLPVLLTVWIMSYVYRWISKHCVEYLRIVVVPIVTLLVTGSIGVMFIGPLGYNIGIYLGQAFDWLFTNVPWLAGLVDGATRPLVIFTGMHSTMGTIMMNSIANIGYEMLGPVHAICTMASAGMCFGAFLRAKDPVNKSTFFSSFISAFIGITEPSLYCVAMRFKKSLIALMIGGGVSGALVAVFGAKAITFAMPSIISLPAYAGSISIMLIGFVVSFVLTAVLTYVFGFNESIEMDERGKQAEKKAIKLLSKGVVKYDEA